MTDTPAITAPTSRYGRHPAAITGITLAPAYAAMVPPTPVLDGAAWSPATRFAPAGPSHLCWQVLQTTVMPDGRQVPTARRAARILLPLAETQDELEEVGANSGPSQAEWLMGQAEEARAREADVEPEAPLPSDLKELHEFYARALSDEDREPAENEAARLDDWQPPTGWRYDPRDDGSQPYDTLLWPVEQGDTATEQAAAKRVQVRRRWLTAVGLAVVGIVAAAGVILAPRLLHGSDKPIQAVFNAPMMVLRAAGAGRITGIPVKAGQKVDPSTLLLTLQLDPVPDPEVASLQVQSEAARDKLAALDLSLAQPVQPTDTRSHIADLKREREAAANDLQAVQEKIAQATPPRGVERPVLAGVNGVIRSLETAPGSEVGPGTPLVRLLDCDHPFLTLAPGAKLQPGQPVRVSLPDHATVMATVRPSSGISEPANSLVIGLNNTALGGSCPVGTAATVIAAAQPG